MDDCRQDALGCYGTSWAKTPHMDSIATRGVRFDNAIIQNAVCLPSRICMHTGQYAHTNGIMAMGRWLREKKNKPIPKEKNLLKNYIDAGILPVNFGKGHAFLNDWKYIKYFHCVSISVTVMQVNLSVTNGLL